MLDGIGQDAVQDAAQDAGAGPCTNENQDAAGALQTVTILAVTEDASTYGAC